MGDTGYFSEKNLVKAIYIAWNIEATLWLLKDGLKKLEESKPYSQQMKIIFSPWDNNEFNSEVLEPFGYKVEDMGEFREIIDIKTNKIIKYDWSEVKQLV
jgi:hypothetical protein